jgi:hypothetical protein
MIVVAAGVTVVLTAIIPATDWANDTSRLLSGTSLLKMFWRNIDYELPLWTMSSDLGNECVPRSLGALIASCSAGGIGFMWAYSATPLVDMREHHDGPQLLVGRSIKASPEIANTNRNKYPPPYLRSTGSQRSVRSRLRRFRGKHEAPFQIEDILRTDAGPADCGNRQDRIGVRRVEEVGYHKTITRGPQGRTEQVATTRRIDEVPIVSERYRAHQLGVRGKRVRAILVGLPEVLQFDRPLRVWRKRRWARANTPPHTVILQHADSARRARKSDPGRPEWAHSGSEMITDWRARRDSNS